MTTANASKPAYSREQISALTASTVAFAVNFAVWVMFSVIGVKIKAELNLNETEFGLLVATPILTGSLIRLPLGILTDRYGGRIVYFVQMLAVVIPCWLLTYATEYWHFLALGLFVGVAGGSFAVGIAYTSAWFSKERQGTAMGIFGAGNAGSSLTKFIAPLIIAASATASWRAVPKVYAVAMLVMALVFWFLRPRMTRCTGRTRSKAARCLRSGSSSCRCSTCACGASASPTTSCSARSSRWRCGCRSTTSASTVCRSRPRLS